MNGLRNMSLLTELGNLFSVGFYKDAAPTALGEAAAHGDGGEGSLSRRLVTPKPDEGGRETQAEAQQHGKGRARGGRDVKMLFLGHSTRHISFRCCKDMDRHPPHLSEAHKYKIRV